MGGSAPLAPSLFDYIPLTESVIEFSEQTYSSTTENGASKVSRIYPTVLLTIFLFRDIVSGMVGVTGSSIHMHRVSRHFQAD